MDTRLLVLLSVSREAPDQRGIYAKLRSPSAPVLRRARDEPSRARGSRLGSGEAGTPAVGGGGPWENVNRRLIRLIVFIPMSPRLNRFPHRFISEEERRTQGLQDQEHHSQTETSPEFSTFPEWFIVKRHDPERESRKTGVRETP